MTFAIWFSPKVVGFLSPVPSVGFCVLKTHSNENDVVLDFTMGSGTTGLACKNLNRNFIGIEINEEYKKILKEKVL